MAFSAAPVGSPIGGLPATSPVGLVDPGQRSGEARALLPILELMRACYGGTESMRQEGERFLPKEISETEARYRHRLNATTAFNKTKEAVDSASAKPFKNLLTLNGADDEFNGWMRDADLEGHHLHLVAHRFFNEAVLLSRAHILVDHPSTTKLPNLAVQRAMKVRPFMRAVRPEDLLAAYYERVGGDNVCVHARIAAQRTGFDRTSFREVVYDQVFVIEQGVVQLWERPRMGLQGAETISLMGQGGSILTNDPITAQYYPVNLGSSWRLVSEDKVDLDEVPLVTMRTGDRPIFQDLAYKQIAHWRATSSHENVLTAACFPMLGASGINLETDEDPDGKPAFEIGPWKILVSPDPNGRWYFVETEGKAMAAGQKHIESLEVQMEQLSLNPIINQPGRQYIAQNERSITEARVNTVIHDLAITAKDALERAIDFMAKWSGRDPGAITLNMNFDFSGTDQLAKSITEITGLLKEGTITPDAALPELVRLNLLSSEFDVAGEIKRLRERLAREEAAKLPPQDFSERAGATRPDNQA